MHPRIPTKLASTTPLVRRFVEQRSRCFPPPVGKVRAPGKRVLDQITKLPTVCL